MIGIKTAAFLVNWSMGFSAMAAAMPCSDRAYDMPYDFIQMKALQDTLSKQREGEFSLIIEEANKINHQGTYQDVLSIYHGMLERYPEERYPEIAYIYVQARFNMISRLIDLDYPNALDYVSSFKGDAIKRSLFNSIVPQLYEKGKGKEAESLLQEAIGKAEKALEKEKDAARNYFAFQTTYARLLFKMGQYEESLKRFDTIAENGYLMSKDRGLYSEVQVKNKMYKSAFETLEALTKKGMTTPQQKEALKECWVQLGNATRDFDSYLKNLSDTLYRKTEKKVGKHRTNYPAPLFELKDMNGNTVSLATLNGKVVFLDFWATWCGPCVGSFPAMQRAVDWYKDNPNVVFLFINTAEKEEGAERARAINKLMQDKGYRFQVLLDEREGNDYIVNKAYGITGIPAKFVIDPSGTVRYALTGFNGGEDATLEEVRIMVDTLLNE